MNGDATWTTILVERPILSALEATQFRTAPLVGNESDRALCVYTEGVPNGGSC